MAKTKVKDIKVLVFHHNDADGKCAGAIVDYFEKGCHLYSINYGYDVPWNLVKRAQKIYMVDFGLQPFSDMIKMRDMVGRENFIWIDHHATAINDRDDSGQSFAGIQVVGEGEKDPSTNDYLPENRRAGCDLTWQWFVDEVGSAPQIVKMIGRYDIWDLDAHADIMPVQYGIKYANPEAGDKSWWKGMFSEKTGNYEMMKMAGQTCYNYQKEMNSNFCHSHSFNVEWEGLRFLAANALNVSSQLFDAKWNHEDYDAMLVFGFTNGNWSVSMYTDKPNINVGAIAKRHNGGGHVGASGFQCIGELPFNLPTKKG